MGIMVQILMEFKEPQTNITYGSNKFCPVVLAPASYFEMIIFLYIILYIIFLLHYSKTSLKPHFPKYPAKECVAARARVGVFQQFLYKPLMSAPFSLSDRKYGRVLPNFCAQIDHES